MSARIGHRPFRLGRLRHMLFAGLGWGVFALGGSLANYLLVLPGLGMVAGAVLLFIVVVGNGVWQLRLNVLRLRELDLSVLNAGWIMVLHCAVAFLSQADDTWFVVAAMLLLGAKSLLFLWPDEPARRRSPVRARPSDARRIGAVTM